MKRYIILLIIFLLAGCSELEKKKETYSIVKGLNYNKNFDYTKALKEFKLAYKQNPKNKILLSEMGFSYSKLNDFTNARKYYLKVLELEPEDNNALLNLAILDYKEGKQKESLTYLEKISDDSVDYQVFLMFGYIYYDMKNYEKSYAYFIKAINYGNIRNYEFINKFVNILQETDRGDQISSFLYKIYEKDQSYLVPERAVEYSRYIVTFYKDYKKALSILTESLVHEKSNIVIIELVKRNIELKNYRSAKAYLGILTEEYRYNIEALKLKKILKEKGV